MELSFMDPQQRLALQVAWEALEDVGMDPASLRNSHAGVFTASWNTDYKDIFTEGRLGESEHFRKSIGTPTKYCEALAMTNALKDAGGKAKMTVLWRLMGPEHKLEILWKWLLWLRFMARSKGRHNWSSDQSRRTSVTRSLAQESMA
jgi:hypothetical protein